EFGKLVQKSLEGEPYAQQGARDDVLFKMASFLARKFPKGDPKKLAGYFQASIDEAKSDDGASLAVFIEKIGRLQRQFLTEAARERARSEKEAARKAQIAWQKEDLQPFVAQSGGAFESVSDLKLVLVLQLDNFYLVFNGNGWELTHPAALRQRC